LIVANERDEIRPGNIGGRNDGELVPRDPVAIMDRLDQPARDRASNRDTVKHARKEEIVDVPGLSGDLRTTFLPNNRAADGHRAFWSCGCIGIRGPGPVVRAESGIGLSGPESLAISEPESGAVTGLIVGTRAEIRRVSGVGLFELSLSLEIP